MMTIKGLVLIGFGFVMMFVIATICLVCDMARYEKYLNEKDKENTEFEPKNKVVKRDEEVENFHVEYRA